MFSLKNSVFRDVGTSAKSSLLGLLLLLTGCAAYVQQPMGYGYGYGHGYAPVPYYSTYTAPVVTYGYREHGHAPEWREHQKRHRG